MSRRKGIIFGSVAALAFLVFYYLYGGSTTPKGQQPLVRLNHPNLAALKDAFNGSANSVRFHLSGVSAGGLCTEQITF